MITNEIKQIEGAVLRKGTGDPTTSQQLQKEVEDLRTQVKELKQKHEEFEKRLDRKPWLEKLLDPIVSLTKKFSQPRSRMISMETRLKEGIHRFVELKEYDDKRVHIYSDYQDYYCDISKRMVIDTQYHYGDFLFTQKKFKEQPNRLSLHSFDSTYYRKYENGDFTLGLYDSSWKHEHASFYVLHSDDPKEYLEMAPGTKSNYYQTWQMDSVTHGHSKITETSTTTKSQTPPSFEKSKDASATQSYNEREYTVIVYGRRKFNWWTQDGLLIIMLVIVCIGMILYHGIMNIVAIYEQAKHS